MSLTFGQAKKIVSQWAGRGGKCPDDESVNLFAREVLQMLLNSGEFGSYRKFCFVAEKGCFTAPPDLEAPIKAKIDNEVVSVWNKWFEWYTTRDIAGCTIVGSSILEDPNYFPTVYDVPDYGAQVGAVAFCDEDAGSHVLVKGFDPTGVDVWTTHKGERIHGELLTLEKGKMHFTNVKFGKVTEVVKSGAPFGQELAFTKGYVQLFAYTPSSNLSRFLSGYSPVETTPQYRRFRLHTPKCGPRVKVSVLATVRIRDVYADTDLIPFDNIRALKLAAQTCNLDYNENVQAAQAKEQSLERIIEKENEMKSIQPGQPIDVYKPTSGGAIQNINNVRVVRPFSWRG